MFVYGSRLGRDVKLLSGVNQVGIGTNGLLVGIIDGGNTFSALIAVEFVGDFAEVITGLNRVAG